jgi:hypothetical protein
MHSRDGTDAYEAVTVVSFSFRRKNLVPYFSFTISLNSSQNLNTPHTHHIYIYIGAGLAQSV